jgi:TolB-like protein/Flp pilus assembly protein TadD
VLANEQSVAAVATAILDGTAIDWPAVESNATDQERRLLEELRLLCTLADLHRDVPPLPGEVAAAESAEYWGRLRLIERLGGGAFGEVYRAWDPRLHREVALKLIATDGAGSRRPSAVIREGRLLARVRHPGVVTIYDAEQIGSRLGLSMEFVQGATVEQRLAQKGVCTAAEAIDLGIQLCDALSAVHDAGVLHRDIKASNVVVQDDGRIVLMDFGSGRWLESAVSIDATGTPLYAAPEVLQGHEATVRSDLYSLGVLLYHVLTNSYPVRAATLPELRQAHSRRMHGAGVEEGVWRGIPRRLAAVLARVIDPDPGRRPSSAAALARDLRAVRHGRRARRLAMPVAAAALLTLAVAGAWLTRDTAGAPLRIAVLPFAIDGNDPDTAALRDGLASDLITRLQTSKDVRVISKASAFSVGGANLSLANAGARLGVSLLVTGDLARVGDTISVNARLVGLPRERILWSRDYRRPATELLHLQRAIAVDLAATLQLEPAQPGQRWPTRNPEAYALYVRGRSALDRFTREGTRLALQLFERALELDAEYADVHASLAHLYLVRNVIPHLTAEESFRRATQAADRAMALDATLPAAHVAAARIKSARADWTGAERDYLRAIELGPSDVFARQHYAHWLALLGRPDEAIEQAKIAESLDPYSPGAIMQVASALRFAKRYEEAITYSLKALEIDPGQTMAYHNLGLNYQGLGRLDEAIEAYERRGASGNLGHAYAVAGRTAEARALLKKFEAEYSSTGLNAGEVAQIYIGLGEFDKAFAWLDRMDPLQAGAPTTFKVAPVWDPLRSDPRFTALLRRHGLAD